MRHTAQYSKWESRTCVHSHTSVAVRRCSVFTIEFSMDERLKCLCVCMCSWCMNHESRMDNICYAVYTNTFYINLARALQYGDLHEESLSSLSHTHAKAQTSIVLWMQHKCTQFELEVQIVCCLVYTMSRYQMAVIVTCYHCYAMCNT